MSYFYINVAWQLKIKSKSFDYLSKIIDFCETFKIINTNTDVKSLSNYW